MSTDLEDAKARVARLRALIPEDVTIGISGDPAAATGLLAGCEAWYSVFGGLYPEHALALTRAAQAGDAEQTRPTPTRWQRYGRFTMNMAAACGWPRPWPNSLAA